MELSSIRDYYYDVNNDDTDYSKYSRIELELKYNDEAGCNSIVYRSRSYNNESITYGSINILLRNKEDIENAIKEYISLIDKIIKFVPDAYYDMKSLIYQLCFTGDGYSNNERNKIFNKIKKLNMQLNDNYEPKFTQRINDSLLISIYKQYITIKFSSIEGILSILEADYSLSMKFIDTDDIYHFMDDLIYMRKQFGKLIKKLKELLKGENINDY